MKKIFITILFLGLLNNSLFAVNPVVIMETSKGKIEIELYKGKAPISVSNFLSYVEKGFYKGTIFHRVISNFMIQGGGFTQDMKTKPTLKAIKNEATNKLSNEVGTIAMARTNIVDSATSQFFINTNNNTFLNHRGSDSAGYGYAVFGKVKKGMDVVNKIKKVQTKTSGMYRDFPIETVLIKDIKLKK